MTFKKKLNEIFDFMKSQIILKQNEDRRIRDGHLWIFSNEIAEFKGEAQNGEIVEVYDSRKNFLGEGFYNKNSLISVRILNRNHISNLNEDIKEKIKSAYKLRKQIYPERNSFRLVFSESDFLPGLIIDKYNNTYVLQIYSAGMQKNISLVINVLKNEFNAKNIFTKNEVHFRKLETLLEEDEILFGEKKEEVIDDGLIKYKIDFEKGHKTGFYFDQNDNRFFIEKFVNGKTVLDAFCNSGGFGLHAAKAGAKSITFLDSSAGEIENSKINFKLNELNNESNFLVDDVFDYLEKSIKENINFDIIILDPPAFAKNKKSLPKAKKGYEKLNRLAIENLNEGGYLITSSCSHHLGKDDFIKIVNSSAAKLEKKIQLVYFNGASLDHPQIPSMEETTYLKFGVFRIL
jgi:23S rRNA (cytosine1962-C5)-methyltransferase